LTQKIAIFYNPRKAEAAEKALVLQRAFKKYSIETIIQETKRSSEDWGVLDSSFALVIALGGDGTFLLSSKQVIKHQIPLLGVNFGHLGFLSEYGDIEIEELAEEIFAGNFVVEERYMLEAEESENKTTVLALNDIAVNRSLSANLLHTDLYLDSDLLHSFRSDGIIICTPTGSTAYALSAGGAVMDPNIKAFQIVPIAAHSLNSRPHVISDNQEIVLISKDSNAPFVMQADGQELISLNPGAKIRFYKSRFSLKLAKLTKRYRSFYSILRDKMKWGFIDN
jgi:NAD+ kinase